MMAGDVLATLRRPFGDDLATFGRRSGAPESRADRAFCLRVADRDEQNVAVNPPPGPGESLVTTWVPGELLADAEEGV